MSDDRLALLVTESQAHGVVAALATAGLTGAFAAATARTSQRRAGSGGEPQPEAAPSADRPRVPATTLDDLLATLAASAQGVLHGGEPIAAFVAILDADARAITWACAGHPGALVVTPGAAVEPLLLGGGGERLGDPRGGMVRGVAPFEPGMVLVVASSAVRRDAMASPEVVRERIDAGPRLASRLVEATGGSPPSEDLLAVVIRQRRDHRRSATL